ANRPKGEIDTSADAYTLATTDQLLKAKYYKPLLVAYRNGAPVRLSDLGDVVDSVQDIRNVGIVDGGWGIFLIISRQPGANIIDTVDRLYAAIPQLKASISPAIHSSIVMDRTTTIRASVHDVEFTLLLSIALVIMVVFVFLRNVRATMIPGLAVPLSLIGTFGVMYLFGYSVDNLSLMALTISTGFVVDDAIVVVENISRHLEEGETPFQAAIKGAAGIGFTVLSMSTSLVAVFIPILLMGGIVGRLFREFAVTLSAAIAVSLVVSLTTTPMMCAHLLRPGDEHSTNWFLKMLEDGFDATQRGYQRGLDWVLRHRRITLGIFFATFAINIWMFVVIPKGFFPQEDVGRMFAFVVADEDTSFQAMQRRLVAFSKVLQADPAISHTIAFAGANSGSINQGRMFITMTPLSERKISVYDVINRIRAKAAKIPGATLYMQAMQDLSIGGRLSNAQFQYTLSGDNLEDLNHWAPILLKNMRHLPEITDLSSDQENNGLDAKLMIDRATASRLGLTPQTIDDTLYDAFGQRLVSTMYTSLNQYYVVMEVAPEFWQNPATLDEIYLTANSNSAASGSGTPATIGGATSSISNGLSTTSSTSSSSAAPSGSTSTSGGSATTASTTTSSGTGSASPALGNATQVPLSAFTHFQRTNTPLQVNHQGQFPAVTLSFNLATGVSLGQAVDAIEAMERKVGLPPTIRGGFQGTAQAFQESLKNEPLLILAALLSVYIVLGILYESYIHPITILSTLPSAGVGALLFLMLFHYDLSIIALIGIILLIGIVKKNAIMMVDFALEVERREHKSSLEAIRHACRLRFRPIMMTTMAAMLGGLPLAVGGGTGSELRQPLGITIVGGLMVSQMLTLFTTPIVYLYLDELSQASSRFWASLANRLLRRPAAEAPGIGAGK
ncbi:MAG TPA: efflux RND transporter permease subunit, partial [Candidatus Binataceae bacterium]|nr:efflux RND transporter permease subunit [Candidatus Binataceae bacterium]